MKKPDLGTFILRIGLGIYFLVFGLLKFISSGPMTQMVYPMFYGELANPTLIYILGGIQILMSIFLLIGFQTLIASALTVAMQVSTFAVTIGRIFDPFTFPEAGAPNFLFFSVVPVTLASIALLFSGPGSFSVDGALAKKQGNS